MKSKMLTQAVGVGLECWLADLAQMAAAVGQLQMAFGKARLAFTSTQIVEQRYPETLQARTKKTHSFMAWLRSQA